MVAIRQNSFLVLDCQINAESGSQLSDMPYEVYAKLYGATKMQPEDCKESPCI